MKDKNCVSGTLLFMVACFFWMPIDGLVEETRVNGHEIFFKQSNLGITIPVYKESVKIFKDTPLAKLSFTDLTVRPRQKFEYSLSENVSWLQLTQDGTLRFSSDGSKNVLKLNVYINKTYKGNLTKRAKATINMKSFEIKSKKDIQKFCKQHLCFWDSIQYRVAEGDYRSNSSRPKFVGSLAPKLYSQLCSKYTVAYNLTGTNLLQIKHKMLYAAGVWDYDEANKPGPRLQPEVTCHIKTTDGKWQNVVTKVLDIRVVDLNDNSIQLINNNSTLFFERNYAFHYQGYHLTGPFLFLVASDKDTVQVNRRLRYSLLNDTLDEYEVMCIKRIEKYEEFPNFKTGIYCTFKYKVRGYYKQVYNCVTLRIKEYLFNNTEVFKDIVVCAVVESNRDKPIEPLPTMSSRIEPAVYNVIRVIDPKDPQYMIYYNNTFTTKPPTMTEMYYELPDKYSTRNPIREITSKKLIKARARRETSDETKKEMDSIVLYASLAGFLLSGIIFGAIFWCWKKSQLNWRMDNVFSPDFEPRVLYTNDIYQDVELRRVVY